MNVQVILLGHKARVGKDTLGNFLIKSKGYKRYGFADKLKSVVGDLYNFSSDQLNSELKDKIDNRYSLSPRQILQEFGQEQRKRHSDIWALYVSNCIINEVKNKQNCNFVITDFRFPNEYYSLSKHLCDNLDYVRVVASKIVRPDLPDFAGSSDISELALDDFPKWTNVIENKSSIENFYKEYELDLLEKGIVL
jgi:hypothetical protein